jgi:hypothetical protein
MSGSYQRLNAGAYSTLTATIANGGTVSDAVNVKGNNVTGIFMPAAWTAANITFQASVDDGTTFGVVYGADATGVLTVTTLTSPTAATYIQIPAGTFDGCTHIKVVSSAAQGASRAVTVAIRDYA